MISFVQVSDVHIGTGERNEKRARRLFERIAALAEPVDAVLVTGDIADHGAEAEYVIAKELLDSLPFPVFTCPGNHDERGAYSRVLLGADAGTKDAETADAGDGTAAVNRVHRAGGVVFALCDSTVPGESYGLLDDATLTWLDEVLAAASADEEPVVVCFHHPPVVIHAPYLDRIRQTGEERLAQVLDQHRGTAVALLCGHAHTPAASTFAGLPLVICPSVISTVTLPWEGGHVINNEPPAALAFHVLDDDRRLITHFRVVL